MPTLASFIDRYFPDPDPVVSADTVAVRCPVCDRPHALRVRAFPEISGAMILCSCGATSDAIAAALDVPASTFDAHLGAVSVSGSATLSGTILDAPDAATLPGLLTRSGLASIPPAEPLIADTLNRRTLAFMAGAPGSAKSFHLLAWAAHIATGTPWQGRKVERGRVLYIVAEGAYGIHDRLTAWETHTGHSIPDEGLSIYPDALQLTDETVLSALRVHVTAEDYDLIAIDTLSRCAVGLDENSAADMSRFVEAAETLKRATTRGTVVIAHHSSKSGAGLRGSSVIEGAADTVYLTARRRDGDFILTRDKNKSGPREDAHVFTLQPVGDSAVLVAEGLDPSPREDSYLTAWRALDSYFGSKGQVFTRAEAWATIRTDERFDLGRSSFYRQTDALIHQGIVEKIDTSAKASDRFRIDRDRASAMRLPLIPTPEEFMGPLTALPGDDPFSD